MLVKAAVIVIAAVVSLNRPVTGWTVSYNDCRKPTHLSTYKAESFCNINKPLDAAQNRKYSVLQRTRTYDLKGYSCSVVTNTFELLCGVWGHSKLLDVPHLNRHETLTVETCRDMIRRRKYALSANKEVTIDIGVPNYHRVDLLGALYVQSGKLICSGRQGKTQRGVTLSDVMILREHVILIQEESFRTRDEIVEVVSDHVTLNCPASELGCQEAAKTYFWLTKPPACNLEVINHLSAHTVMNTFLLDDSKQVLLNQTGTTIILECDVKSVITTEYQDLFVIDHKESEKLQKFRAGDLDMAIETAIALSYTSYKLENRIDKGRQRQGEQLCAIEQSQVNDIPKRLVNNRFYMRRGESIVTFECELKTAQIRSTPNCYEAIPIAPSGYVTYGDRVYTDVAATTLCYAKFPIVVKAQQGWLELHPQVKARVAPLDHMASPVISDHIHINRVHLYTEEELEQWEDLLRFPKYRAAIHHEIYTGDCLNNGQCNPSVGEVSGLPKYDISALSVVIQNMNPWLKLRKWIREYGDLLALLVIIIVFVKMLADITMLVMTLVQHGVGAAATLFFTLYLGNRNAYTRIKRKYTKARAEQLELQQQQRYDDQQRTERDREAEHQLRVARLSRLMELE